MRSARMRGKGDWGPQPGAIGEHRPHTIGDSQGGTVMTWSLLALRFTRAIHLPVSGRADMTNTESAKAGAIGIAPGSRSALVR